MPLVGSIDGRAGIDDVLAERMVMPIDGWVVDQPFDDRWLRDHVGDAMVRDDPENFISVEPFAGGQHSCSATCELNELRDEAFCGRRPGIKPAMWLVTTKPD